MLMRIWNKGTLPHCCDCKLVQPLRKSIWYFPRKLAIALHEYPDILFLGTYQNNAAPYHKDRCSPMFITALYVIPRNWSQPRCHSNEDTIQKMWFIYMIECSSAIKNKDIMNFAGKRIELENIILSEVTQPQRWMHHMFSLISRHKP